jgi:neutral ceramidase
MRLACVPTGHLASNRTELVRESVERPLREGKVPHGKLDAKVADNFERWIEPEGMLLGEEVIRVMTRTKTMSRDVALWGGRRRP